MEGMPDKSFVLDWLAADPSFAAQYARAREEQADTFADDIVEIADDARNDWMERHGKDDLGWVENGEHIQRSKLRVDARKWTAAKLRPKKYGDKIETQLSTAPGGALNDLLLAMADDDRSRLKPRAQP
jgi:hypothetical protein